MGHTISPFRGEYRYLSNFWESEFYIHGYKYLSTEHFYQSMKALYPEDKAAIRTASTPKEAKALGNSIAIAPQWVLHRVSVMRLAVLCKFSQNTDLAQKLVGTKETLVEGNTWHDNFWGSCSCARCGNSGLNTLGNILMDTRETLSLVFP